MCQVRAGLGRNRFSHLLCTWKCWEPPDVQENRVENFMVPDDPTRLIPPVPQGRCVLHGNLINRCTTYTDTNLPPGVPRTPIATTSTRPPSVPRTPSFARGDIHETNRS